MIYSMEMAKDKERSKDDKKVTVSATVYRSLAERLELFCEENAKYKSNVVEKAIEEHLDREEKKNRK